MWRRFLSFLPFVVLFLLWLTLVYKSFTPDVWLSGWDNLHPEFNFPLNISRSLSAAWQEYQGLGLLGGMAHAADLPRQLVLWATSFVLPKELLRWFWTFLMLLLGPFGVYFLISKVLLRDEKKYIKSLASLVGSVFYLLNLAILQYLFTPFDAFASFYGFLPWLILFALNFLRLGGRKNLLKFIFISVIAIPSFYVQTLFIVYLLVLFILALELVIRNRFSGLKRLMVLGFTIVSVNAFWLLPAVYFSLTNSQVVTNAHQNSIATSETQIYNEARGTLSDIALLKGYWFDYYDLGQNNQFDYLYTAWINYIEKPGVATWGYILFGVAVVGIAFQLANRKSLVRFSPLILLVLVYFMLATVNPPFGSLFSFISQKTPLFSEIFRNVFTKWSGMAALVYSLGLASFVGGVGKILNRSFLKIFVLLLVGILIFGSIYVVRPVFEGNLVSKTMKVKVPNEYFQAMNYLNSQDEGRVLFMPIQSFWGWNFYKWGYRGSGFLWYGIKQPILDRAFDVWSPYNEGFYNEVSFALYSKDNDAFIRTLKKYQVKYIFLDESVINAGGDDRLLFLPQIKSALSNFREATHFGFLTIYQTNFVRRDNFISAPSSFAKANVNLIYSQFDPIYTKYGDYIQNDGATGFPFVNLDKRGNVEIGIMNNELRIMNKKTNSEVRLPIQEKTAENFGQGRGFKEAYNCDLKKKGKAIKERPEIGNYYAAYDGGVSCDYFYYPTLKYNQGYILRVKGENTAGRGLKIYLQNIATGRMDLEELLPTGAFDETFTILPKSNLLGDRGYTLNLETRSFGRISSENTVEKIEFYPFDYNLLTGIYIGSPNPETAENNLTIKDVKKYGTWLYKVDVQGNGLVQLEQGYDEGWIAIQLKSDKVGQSPSKSEISSGRFQQISTDFNRFQLLRHVKVNSWSNGWLISTNSDQLQPVSTIYLVFWPQLLEYLGFVILAGTLAGLSRVEGLTKR